MHEGLNMKGIKFYKMIIIKETSQLMPYNSMHSLQQYIFIHIKHKMKTFSLFHVSEAPRIFCFLVSIFEM